MKNRLVLTLALIPLLGIGVAASAQDADPGHPREGQVDQRLQDQQARENSGVQSGKINAKQEARDTNRDAKVQSEMSADEAKHGGHITTKEQAHMNKQLNKNSQHIHNQKNPIKGTPPINPTPSTGGSVPVNH